MGGMTPLPDEIFAEIQRVSKNKGPGPEDPREEWIPRMEKIIAGDK